MHGPVVVGVAGGSASGKTTVIRAISDALEGDAVSVLPHDAYYRDQSHLTPDERARVNYDHPHALETELLVEHLRQLRAGEPVRIPVYDFATHTRTSDTRSIEPRRAVIVDGMLILAERELRELMDIRVFVDTDADLRLIRRVQRDINERGRSFGSVVDQYLATVRPMHEEFVEPSKRHAHVILPCHGENPVGIDMLVTKVRDILATGRRVSHPPVSLQ